MQNLPIGRLGRRAVHLYEKVDLSRLKGSYICDTKVKKYKPYRAKSSSCVEPLVMETPLLRSKLKPPLKAIVLHSPIS